MQGIVIERFYWEDLMVNWSLDDPDFDARFFHAGFEFADGGHSIVQDASKENGVGFADGDCFDEVLGVACSTACDDGDVGGFG